MIEINRKNLPDFLKASPILDDFEDENGYMMVQEKNYKENKNVSNIEEYINLLQTISFFQVEIPNEIKDFENGVNNENDILEFLLNKRDDAFMKEILNNFKNIISERYQNLDFSMGVSLHSMMQDMEDEDESYKNPYLYVNFYFKNKTIDGEAYFEYGTNELIKMLEVIKNADRELDKKNQKKKLKKTKGIVIGDFLKGNLVFYYNGKDLNLCFKRHDDNEFLGGIMTSYTFNYKKFIHCIEKNLDTLEKFLKLSKNKKIMAGYGENGNLYVVNNVYGSVLEINDFLNDYEEEIEEETGKKFNKEEFKKWLIKHKRIFNNENKNLFFGN